MGKQTPPRAYTDAAQKLGHINLSGVPTCLSLGVPRLLHLRRFAKALIQRVNPEAVKKSMELCPGGDIRVRGNQWIRVAWRDAGLVRAPREHQIREAVKKLVAKRKLRVSLSEWNVVFEHEFKHRLKEYYFGFVLMRLWEG